MALRPDHPLPSRRSRGLKLERSRGRLDVVWRARDGVTRIDRLFQEGALQARLPRDHGRGCPDVATINTGGGLTGGDRMATAIRYGAGTAAGATTQAAEKIYRAAGGVAAVRTDLVVEADAWAEWLPQETILFDGCALERYLRIDLAGSGRLLLVEPLVFGRLAMGENVARLHLVDRIEVVRDGRLTWLDVTRMATPADRLLDQPALGGGLRALATVVYAGADAATALAVLRDGLAEVGLAAAATRLDALVIARLHGPDPLALRRALVTLLAQARAALAGLPPRLPRLWHS